MPLFLWMSRRSFGMPQCTPNSWAIRPPRSERIEKPRFQLRVGFAFSVAAGRERTSASRSAPNAIAGPTPE